MCDFFRVISPEGRELLTCRGWSLRAKAYYLVLLDMGSILEEGWTLIRSDVFAKALGTTLDNARECRRELVAGGVLLVRSEFHCPLCTYVAEKPWPGPCPDCDSYGGPRHHLYYQMGAPMETRTPPALPLPPEEGPYVPELGDEPPPPMAPPEPGYWRGDCNHKVDAPGQCWCRKCQRHVNARWVRQKDGQTSPPEPKPEPPPPPPTLKENAAPSAQARRTTQDGGVSLDPRQVEQETVEQEGRQDSKPPTAMSEPPKPFPPRLMHLAHTYISEIYGLPAPAASSPASPPLPRGP
jgi:hypothetical protein